MKVFFYGIVFILLANTATAQELVLGLEENPHAKAQPKTTISLKGPMNAPPSLSLPFIDDFAYPSPYPPQSLWQSKGVYVNNTYAINMPTVGVATFDALNDQGKLYAHLTSTSSPADSLISLPIDLAGTADVVLSFFYEPGGVGDMPGNTDFLNLEFYSPVTGWNLVWQASVDEAAGKIVETNVGTGISLEHVSDTLDNKFIYTALAIDNSYLQDGFRFRFVNFVTLVVNKDVPGRASNADIWHLDFVYLDKNRDISDTNLPDVAIGVPQKPVTITYESVPASHLNSTEAQRQLFGNPMTFDITYRNLGWGTRNITRQFSISPLSGSSSLPETYAAGSENISAGETQVREYHFDPYTFLADGDAAAYKITSYLITDTDVSTLRKALRENDTTSYIQKFYDYYAYDDGTAENGYGLYGNRTDNGRVAVQYMPYKSDSLRGVYMYFNMAKDTANAKSFKIAIWSDNNGMPGALLYSQKVDRPAFRDSMNKFVAYKFSTPLHIAQNQKFYVGWMQMSEGFLNIGYDANRAYGGKNFYSLSSTGPWLPSEYQGSLMIRPIFCKSENFPSDYVPPPVEPSASSEESIILYPNPVSNILYIRSTNTEMQDIQACYIEVYDMAGNLLLSNYSKDGSIMVSSLRAGMYIVRIKEKKNSKVKAVSKIIVNR